MLLVTFWNLNFILFICYSKPSNLTHFSIGIQQHLTVPTYRKIKLNKIKYSINHKILNEENKKLNTYRYY